MGIELVHDQDDPLGVRVVDIDQRLDAGGEVDEGPLLAHRNRAPAPQRFSNQDQIGDPTPDVFRIVAGGMPRDREARWTDLVQQLPTRFVEADDRSGRDIRTLVDRQDILQMPDEIRISGRGQAPLFTQMRFELVFLSV